jgi:hypothetical protein
MSDTITYSITVEPADGEWHFHSDTVNGQDIQVKYSPRATVTLPDGTTSVHAVALSLTAADPRL